GREHGMGGITRLRESLTELSLELEPPIIGTRSMRLRAFAELVSELVPSSDVGTGTGQSFQPSMSSPL
ncbi:hypothetical protein OXX79_014138, partial [Metschnikowia pulcherrima]